MRTLPGFDPSCWKHRPALLAAGVLLVLTVAASAQASASPFPRNPQAAARAIAPPAVSSAEEHADRGRKLFYSAQFDEARSEYGRAIDGEPGNPLYWAGLADCDLFNLMLAAGRLDAQLYGESNDLLKASAPAPNPTVLKEMDDALARARSLSEQQLASNPNNAQAHYTLGVAYAIEANYDFSLAHKYWETLRTTARAKAQHERVRELDPSNHDANLVIGTFEYAVGSLPPPVRWGVYLAGYSGSREKGLELLQDTMERGPHTGPAAITLLGLFYSREKNYAESRKMFQKMLSLFPENYIAEMTIAEIARKQHDLEGAVNTYQDVARKMESHAPGFTRVPADRLYFDIASLLEQQHRPADALAYYTKLLSLKEKNSLLEAQSHLRLGDIYRQQGQTALAQQAYEKAGKLPFPQVQREANARLRALRD